MLSGDPVTLLCADLRVVHAEVRLRRKGVVFFAPAAFDGSGLYRQLLKRDRGVTWERGHTDGASLLAAKLLVESA